MGYQPRLDLTIARVEAQARAYESAVGLGGDRVKHILTRAQAVGWGQYGGCAYALGTGTLGPPERSAYIRSVQHGLQRSQLGSGGQRECNLFAVGATARQTFRGFLNP